MTVCSTFCQAPPMQLVSTAKVDHSSPAQREQLHPISTLQSKVYRIEKNPPFSVLITHEDCPLLEVALLPGNALAIVDAGNKRVVQYSPATSFGAASFVYGQANFVSSVAGTTQSSLNSNPFGLCSDIAGRGVSLPLRVLLITFSLSSLLFSSSPSLSLSLRESLCR
jgi:hypothetical protein